jgi:hypothetical protein
MNARGNSSQFVPSKSSESSERQAHGRSRITNGRDVLPNVDGRSIVARRFRDIVSAMVADQGGAD